MRLAILICVAACGSPDSNHPDAAKPIDAAIDAHHDIDAPPVAREGMITLSESTTVGHPADSGVEVEFADGSPMGMVTGTDGACKAYDIAGSGPVRHSAGAIAITGTTVSLTLTDSAGHYTSTPAVPTDLFATAATIHIAGAGSSDFAAFTGDVTAPGPVAGFTPPATVSLSAGTTLTWTAAASTIMQVAIFAGNQSTFGLVFCRVPDNGSYTVAPSSLALLPAGSTMGAVLLGRTNETVLTTSSGKVTLQAVSANGSEAVTFAN